MRPTKEHKQRKAQLQEALNFIEGWCMVKIAEDGYKLPVDLYFDVERAAEYFTNQHLSTRNKMKQGESK